MVFYEIDRRANLVVSIFDSIFVYVEVGVCCAEYDCGEITPGEYFSFAAVVDVSKLTSSNPVTHQEGSQRLLHLYQEIR